MTEQQEEKQPAGVLGTTKQAGEVRDRWSWAEPSVWTERMLTALEKGVRGGKWYSLMDKVYARENMRAAYKRVKANGGSAGVDHQTIKEFERHMERNLDDLTRALSRGDETYRPQAVRRCWIEKAGSPEKRPLGIPTVRDRVVQGALRQVLEPIFEREFSERSYGFRPKRGCQDALRRVDELLKIGYGWVVDADLKSYFDTIPHERLIALVREKVSDGRVIALLEAYLSQEVMDGLKSWTPEEGSPQGAIISPLLSNIYLNPFDHWIAERGMEMVRYADDFVILCRSRQEAEEALNGVRQWTAKAGLRLHPEKTRIVDATQAGGFDFLGYHFERGMKWPRRKSLKKFKDAIRAKTRRTSGHSLKEIITNVNQTGVGWFGYFKQSHRTTFSRLDQWIRMRLRSILRKRSHGQGRGRGLDHFRWPNAFFAKEGLFSLERAYGLAGQSSWR